MRTPSIILGLLLLTPIATAQRGIGSLHTGNLAGDNFLPPGSMNLSQAIAAAIGEVVPIFAGIVRMPNGNYIVSATKTTLSGPHKFYEISADGTLIGSADQPTGANNDAIGLNDLAWDGETGANSRIWAGSAGRGISSFDWQTFQFDPLFDPLNPQFGLKIMDGWVGNFVQCSTIAEIGGAKVFISSDVFNATPLANPPIPGARINYHTLGGVALDVPMFQDSTPDISDPDVTVIGTDNSGKWGAAYDSVRGTVWWHVDLPTASVNPNGSRTRFIEMNLDGTRTGQIFQGDPSVGGISWGCEMYVDENGDVIMVYLVSAAHAVSDDDAVIIEVNSSFQFGGGCGGDISYSGEPFIGGQDWMITLSNAPTNPLDAAVLTRGAADPNGGITIPGITNCNFLLRLIGFQNLGFQPLVLGEASFNQVIPEDPALIGLEIFYQWFLPSLTTLPLDLSAGGAAKIGNNSDGGPM